MKIVEYTLGLPPYRRGGLTRYSVDLASELSKDDQVYLLYPGQINPFSKKIKVNFVNTSYPFSVVELKNMLPISLGLGIDINHVNSFMEKRDLGEIKGLISKIKPDVIHFHTLMGIPRELLEYLHKIKIRTILTTHDFYGLCPKTLGDNVLQNLQSSRCTDDCMLCKNGPSYYELIMMQSYTYKKLKESKFLKKVRRRGKRKLNNDVEEHRYTYSQARQALKLREYYRSLYMLIDEFHFNSSVSEHYVKRFFPNCHGKVIPITHAGLVDRRAERSYQKHNYLHIGYVGSYDHKKGFFRLKSATSGLNNIIVDCYGDVADSNFFHQEGRNNHGIIQPDQMTNAFRMMDVLVLPSLCHETFGFVVLEALLQGTPCLVSNTVGAKDIVPENFIFNNEKELFTKLKTLKTQRTLDMFKNQTNRLHLDFDMHNHAIEIKRTFYEY